MPGALTRAIPFVDAAFRAALGPSWSTASPEVLRRRVQDRRVLITGASSGIGAACAESLAGAGAEVIMVARRTTRLAELDERIRSRGGRSSWRGCDLSDPDSVDAALTALLEFDQQHPIDIVINSAGRSMRRSLAATAERLDDLDSTIAVNHLGPARLMSGLLPRLRDRRRGHVINIATVAVDLPAAHWASYTASKAAFETWLRCNAAELRADGVLVSSIHFPLVHTAMSAPSYPRSTPGLTAEAAAAVVGRVIVSRPRTLVPWWVRVPRLLAADSQPLGDAFTAAVLRARR